LKGIKNESISELNNLISARNEGKKLITNASLFKLKNKRGGYARVGEGGGGKEGGRGKKKEGVWAYCGTAPQKGG
jgi:hypothetical protein